MIISRLRAARHRRGVVDVLTTSLVAAACAFILLPPAIAPTFWFAANEAAAQTEAEAATEQAPGDVDLQAIQKQIQRQHQAMMALYQGQARPVTFPADAVKQSGGEPEAVHQFVREHTRWVPYRGSLRGASGTLVDRTANHCDRALLTAKMLQAAGYEARLVRGRLPKEKARSLMKAVENQLQDTPLPANPPLEAPNDSPTETDQRVARALDMSIGQLMRRRSAARLEKQRALEDTLGTALPQAKQLHAMVKDHRKENAPSKATSSVLEAMRNHWWVQWRAEGASDWKALDPMQSAEQASQPLSEAKQHFAVGELPDNLRHFVTLRVVAEQWTGDGLKEHEAVRHRIDPRQLVIDHVSLSFSPLDWSESEDEGATPREAAEQTLPANEEWLPVLSVGDETIDQSSILTDGTINKNPALSGTERKISDATNALSGLDFGRSSKGDNTELTAVHLDFLVHRPGAEVTRHRRTVMDVLGPAKRQSPESLSKPKLTDKQAFQRGVELLTTTRTLVLPGQSRRDVVTRLSLVDQLQNSQVEAAAVDAIEKRDEQAFADRLSKRGAMPGPLYAWAVLRNAWSPSRGQWFVDRPIIANLHQRPNFAEDGSMNVRLAMDVVTNPMQPAPGAATNAFEMRLTQGVLDTRLESVALQRRSMTLAANASAQWAAAQARDLPWAVAREPSELPQPVAARIAEAQKQHVVVAPKRAGMEDNAHTLAWWRIDPTNGQTLGIGVHGWGVETTEKGALDLSVATRTQKAVYHLYARGFHAAQKHGPLLAMLCMICTGVTHPAWGVGGEAATIGCEALCAGFGP
jgi:hypothetical protein